MKKRSIPELFPIMVEKENLKVEYNFEVINIKKEDEKFKLESFNGDKREFDDIFWAVPLPDFQRVADKSVLYKNVTRIVKSSNYSHVATSMVDIKDVTRGSRFNIFTENVNVTKFNHSVCADFDFPAAGLVT
jgi:protoporphyrinogen oxidase